jgi:hypothetical protein
MKVIFVGNGRCGKDEACIWFGQNTSLKNAGTTSKYLTHHVAMRLGLPDHVVYQDRHQNRELWYRIGKEVRFNDPGILLREAFENGSVSGGVRDYEEVVYARESGLVDLIVWIDRPVPKDPTVEFDHTVCDITIPNHGTLAEYHSRLERLAKAINVLRLPRNPR